MNAKKKEEEPTPIDINAVQLFTFTKYDGRNSSESNIPIGQNTTNKMPSSSTNMAGHKKIQSSNVCTGVRTKPGGQCALACIPLYPFGLAHQF